MMVDNPFVGMCGQCNNVVWDEMYPHGNGASTWYCSEKCWGRRNDLVPVVPGKDGRSDMVEARVGIGVSDEMLDMKDQRARKVFPKYKAIAQMIAGEILCAALFDTYHLLENDSYESRKRLADNVSQLIIGPQGPSMDTGRTWVVPEEEDE